jgi:branched-chain amino acid transport system substrate-binding protein
LFIVLVPEIASNVDDALAGVIYGAVLIVVMYVERGGIVGFGRRVYTWIKRGGSMQRRLAMTLVMVPIVVGALALAGCGRGGNNSGAGVPGVTATSIKLGGSYPFSGPASAYGTIGRSAKAYFDYLNSKGGVHGRKITFDALDDAYDPAKAVANARRLITQDKVFALFNTLGTANNLAIWDYVNQQKVPQVFVSTGASDFGKDIAKHPYTIGFQPDYVTEGTALGQYLKKVKPTAKVAVLYQNDGLGSDTIKGFQKGIAGSGIKIVAKQSYEITDPTVAPQVTKLAHSGADAFLDVATPKPAAQSIGAVAASGWKPTFMLSNVSASKDLVFKPVGLKASKGIISDTYLMDPDSSQFANDPAMMTYKANLKRFAPSLDPNEPFNVYGWVAGETIAHALEQAGRNLTRDSLMKAVRNMNTSLPLLLPGVREKTSPTDGYLMQTVQIERFDGQNWKTIGGLVSNEQ